MVAVSYGFIGLEVGMPTLHTANRRRQRRMRQSPPKLLRELQQRAKKRARARELRGL